MYVNGQWHIKDVGSSSGTFLNHMRLSQPNMVSRLYTIKDGDIVQLGIDFRGGEEMIFRCVRIRIECNRSWQQQPNEFKYVWIDCESGARLTGCVSSAKTPKV
jgi:pSer/pThr/pTyr-binding forkhead associated (FHA) protein